MVTRDNNGIIPPYLKSSGRQSWDVIKGFTYMSTAAHVLPSALRMAEGREDIIHGNDDELLPYNHHIERLHIGFIAGLFSYAFQATGYTHLIKEHGLKVLLPIIATNALSLGYEFLRHNIKKKGKRDREECNSVNDLENSLNCF